MKYITHTHTYTPYTPYMFRPFMWPSSGKGDTKDRFIDKVQKFLNQWTYIKHYILEIMLLESNMFICTLNLNMYFKLLLFLKCWAQWPRGLRRRPTAARLLRSWVRIPPGAWVFVCCECCVSSGRGLCDGLITRPEESYRLWCAVVCELETS